MGIPPGVPVKAAKSIGPYPSYCRADCPGTQRPAHPPGACPGVPTAWLPAAALRLMWLGVGRQLCLGRGLCAKMAHSQSKHTILSQTSASLAQLGFDLGAAQYKGSSVKESITTLAA